jgi:hypothetical protein
MKRAAACWLLSFAGAACTDGETALVGVAPMSIAMPPTDALAHAPEVPAERGEQQLAMQVAIVSHYPCSLGGAEHERAMAWLVEHGDVAHPALVAAIERNEVANMRAVGLVLAAIGEPESVAVLEKVLLENGELLSWDAALGLSRHPHPSAEQALIDALREPAGAFARTAAADVLGDPEHRAACPALLAQSRDRDETVRYHMLQAIGHAGCLPAKEWRARTRSDASADIRDLPRKLAAQR